MTTYDEIRAYVNKISKLLKGAKKDSNGNFILDGDLTANDINGDAITANNVNSETGYIKSLESNEIQCNGDANFDGTVNVGDLTIGGEPIPTGEVKMYNHFLSISIQGSNNTVYTNIITTSNEPITAEYMYNNYKDTYFIATGKNTITGHNQIILYIQFEKRTELGVYGISLDSYERTASSSYIYSIRDTITEV